MAFGLIIIFNFSSFSQQITITGNVTDDKDAPLPNVKVVEKGTNNGVLTDFDGNYSITTNSCGGRALLINCAENVSS